MNAPVRPEEAGAIAAAVAADVGEAWDRRIVPALAGYIAVPAKSPMFDADWASHGHIERVVRDAAAWVESRRVPGLRLEVVRLPGRTPVVYFEVDATRPGAGDTVLLYGHLDKQPEFSGWRSDLGPWTPKFENGLLYGRGGADDGYAIYAAVTAIEAMKARGLAHPRLVGLVETCEESGSTDLPAYIDALTPRLGRVGLVVCLDSGAGNYDQLWLTTSLRGMASGVLKVEILTEGVHSGDASGVVPSSFRILRQVLDRLEDSRTGRLLPESFHCEIPASRVEQARVTAAILGDEVWKRYPWACGADGGPALPTTTDPVEGLLARTWRPTLSVTGVDGFPDLGSAGNVLRPHTAFKLSLRLPPLVDAHLASQRLKALLEDNAPYNAKVTFHPDGRAGALGATGWNAPELAPWLETA
nr:M20/M25/M40 family metallo-hydrolase [Rubrivivax sp.]